MVKSDDYQEQFYSQDTEHQVQPKAADASIQKGTDQLTQQQASTDVGDYVADVLIHFQSWAISGHIHVEI